jgi:hypothetical protein
VSRRTSRSRAADGRANLEGQRDRHPGKLSKKWAGPYPNGRVGLLGEISARGCGAASCRATLVRAGSPGRIAREPVEERVLLNNRFVVPGIADNGVPFGTLHLFAQHQAKGELTMNRSVSRFGLAAALGFCVLAFNATPAQARCYVSRYYAPTPVYSYYYPPNYYYTPAYSSYYYAPAYRYYHPYRGAHVGWRGGWGWHGRGWHGRYRWR